MALDPSIPLKGIPAPIQSPFTALSEVLQGQRAASELRTLRQQEADQRAIRQALVETGGDLEQALPRITQTNPVLALSIRGELEKAKTQRLETAIKQTAYDKSQFDEALRFVQGLTPETYPAGRQRLVQQYPKLEAYLPQEWDQTQMNAVIGMGQTAQQALERQDRALNLFKDGKFTQAAALFLSGIKPEDPTAAQQWDQKMGILKQMGTPPENLALFGESYSPENLQRAQGMIDPEKLAPGTVLRHPTTGEVLYTAPTAEKPEPRSIAVQAADAYLRGDMDTYNKLVKVNQEVSPPVPTYQWVMPPGAEPGTAPVLMSVPEIRAQGAQKPPDAPTAAQSLAAGFAARVVQAEPTFERIGDKIRDMNLAKFELQTNSWFARPTFQSPEVQAYMQASRNFINANLRRESGAAISPTEFAEARAQYLPQPGDTEETKALKAANRQQIRENLKNEAGRAYKPPVTTKDSKRKVGRFEIIEER